MERVQLTGISVIPETLDDEIKRMEKLGWKFVMVNAQREAIFQKVQEENEK